MSKQIYVATKRREEAKKQLLELIANTFGDVDVTAMFTIKLLEEVIIEIKDRSLDKPLKKII